MDDSIENKPKKEPKLHHRTSKFSRFWEYYDEYLLLILPLLIITPFIAILEIFSFIFGRDVIDNGFLVGLWIADWGFLIGLMAAIQFNNKFKKLSQRIKLIENQQHITKLEDSEEKIIQKKPINKKNINLRITLIGGLIILCIVGVLGYLSYATFLELDEKKEFPLPLLSKSYTLTKIETITEDGKIIEVIKTPFKKSFEMDVKLYSTSLSANNPIHVEAIFNFPDLSEEQWKEFDDFHILAFPKAYDNPESKNYDEASGGIIKMKKSATMHKYFGNTDLMYPLEGDYGFLLLTPELTNKTSSKPLSNGTIEIKIEALSLDKHIENVASFHIYDSNPSANLKFTQIAQAFSYIVIAIGILQLRKDLINGMIWIYERRLQN